MSIVLDTSVVISWLSSDEADTYADFAVERAATEKAIVPYLWYYEVFNIIRMQEKRKRITGEEADGMVRDAKALRVIVDSHPIAAAAPQILELARRHDLTVYDAAYLELALRRGLPLATLDKELIIAAQHHNLLFQV